MIGEKFNYDDVFFRDLTVCVLDTLEGRIRWTNRFSRKKNVEVVVPFYYSLTGDERFLLDTFQDDIVSNNRFVELNTDIIPRGHITFKSFNVKSDEFTNPNVWLRAVLEKEDEIKNVLTKVRAIPISVEYDMSIILANEIDVFKCCQVILDTLWLYKYMYFEHNSMNIEAIMIVPDSNQIQIAREKSLDTDKTIKIDINFEVHTYYPAYIKNFVDSNNYKDSNGDYVGSDYIIIPKKSKWYNSIFSVKKM